MKERSRNRQTLCALVFCALFAFVQASHAYDWDRSFASVEPQLGVASKIDQRLRQVTTGSPVVSGAASAPRQINADRAGMSAPAEIFRFRPGLTEKALSGGMARRLHMPVVAGQLPAHRLSRRISGTAELSERFGTFYKAGLSASCVGCQSGLAFDNRLFLDLDADETALRSATSQGRFAARGLTALTETWSLGAMVDIQTIASGAPYHAEPGVNLRSIQYGRYQGESALSVETELRHAFTPRWAGLVFGGYGETHATGSGFYEAAEDVWTYGAGLRYRIARRLGLGVGLGVAEGTDDSVLYIQIGHAWGGR